MRNNDRFARFAAAAVVFSLLGGCTSNSMNGVPRHVGATNLGSGIYGVNGPIAIATCPTPLLPPKI